MQYRTVSFLQLGMGDDVDVFGRSLVNGLSEAYITNNLVSRDVMMDISQLPQFQGFYGTNKIKIIVGMVVRLMIVTLHRILVGLIWV